MNEIYPKAQGWNLANKIWNGIFIDEILWVKIWWWNL